MHSKAVFISLLVACASATSAYDFNGAAPSFSNGKRCIGSCGTTNQGGSTTNSNTQTDASTHSSNQVTTTGSGNQDTSHNNGGGQDFSGMSFGSLKMGCKRAYLEGRADNQRKHHDRVKKTQKAPAQKNVNVQNKSTNISNSSSSNQQNSNNKVNKNTTTTVNAQKDNNINASNNNGVMVGNGMMCRREFIDLELERRELDTGASVVAALGGLSARDAHDNEQMLATRDVGKMALLLGVRGYDHDEDAEFYKRNVGLQCATEDCNEMMRREAEEMLYLHARDLGLLSEDDGEY